MSLDHTGSGEILSGNCSVSKERVKSLQILKSLGLSILSEGGCFYELPPFLRVSLIQGLGSNISSFPSQSTFNLLLCQFELVTGALSIEAFYLSHQRFPFLSISCLISSVIQGERSFLQGNAFRGATSSMISMIALCQPDKISSIECTALSFSCTIAARVN